MPYYLIKQWTPHRGQTRDNPGCLFYGGMHFDYPLTSVKSCDCYSSLKRAQAVASKRYSIYSPTEVYEVPQECIRPYIRDKVSRLDVPASSAHDTVTVIFAGEESTWNRLDAIRHYNDCILNAYKTDTRTDLNRYFTVLHNLIEGYVICHDTQE